MDIHGPEFLSDVFMHCDVTSNISTSMFMQQVSSYLNEILDDTDTQRQSQPQIAVDKKRLKLESSGSSRSNPSEFRKLKKFSGLDHIVEKSKKPNVELLKDETRLTKGMLGTQQTSRPSQGGFDSSNILRSLNILSKSNPEINAQHVAEKFESLYYELLSEFKKVKTTRSQKNGSTNKPEIFSEEMTEQMNRANQEFQDEVMKLQLAIKVKTNELLLAPKNEAENSKVIVNPEQLEQNRQLEIKPQSQSNSE